MHFGGAISARDDDIFADNDGDLAEIGKEYLRMIRYHESTGWKWSDLFKGVVGSDEGDGSEPD